MNSIIQNKMKNSSKMKVLGLKKIKLNKHFNHCIHIIKILEQINIKRIY